MKEYDFLIEIGTEELPPKILKKIGMDFFNGIKIAFNKNKIYSKEVKWFAAPRNLAITAKISIAPENISFNKKNDFYIHNNLSDQIINKNNPNSSILKKIKKLDSSNNQNIKTEKNNQKNEKTLKSSLLQVINDTLENLKNYKMMRWGNELIPFIRPVNTVTILLNSDIVKSCFFGKKTNRVLNGNRCIKNNKIIINHANDYPKILKEKGYVLADYNIRKKTIKTLVQSEAAKLGGIADLQDNNFIEEITSIIEWPVILYGRFNKRFLSLPKEIIIHIMKENQKYFPVYNTSSNEKILLPCFIFLTNTITNDYRKIIAGHENVLKTRFIDAEFFLRNDNRHRLESYIPKLNSILFHEKLGSLSDKIYRISKLSGWIAKEINENIENSKRAGYLCKCDLMTEMVREFPKLQGTIGMYYALRDKEPEEVAIAQKEYYQPYFISDPIPKKIISCIVSIADKMDTISGIFGINEIPTSSRDPFSLKRAASGILNILITRKISLNWIHLISQSTELYKSKLNNHENTIKNIQIFMQKRLHACYLLQGYRSDIIQFVLKTNHANIVDCSDQIQVIHNFCEFQKKEYKKLHIIYKRISNILKNQSLPIDNPEIQISLSKEKIEKESYIQLINSIAKIDLLYIQKQYKKSLFEIVKLADIVNNFLNNIIVIHKNFKIKTNRILFLHKAKTIIEKNINPSVLKF